jgi:hypothetical protein
LVILNDSCLEIYAAYSSLRRQANSPAAWQARGALRWRRRLACEFRFADSYFKNILSWFDAASTKHQLAAGTAALPRRRHLAANSCFVPVLKTSHFPINLHAQIPFHF